MYKHFKFFELNRHQIIKKNQKIVKENNEKDDENFEKITEMIFSSAVTLFLSLIIEGYYGNYSSGQNEVCEVCQHINTVATINPWLLFVLGICGYLIVFFVTKYIYRFASKKTKKFIAQNKVHSLDVSKEKNKELIDDFDNIGFDYLLIAYDYVEQTKRALRKNKKEIATFYFHEAIYYLRTAIEKTQKILIDKRRELCLNIKGRTDGVDVFRLFNAYKMMLELNESISKLYNGNPKGVSLYSKDLGKAIKHQLSLIQEDITEIGKQCHRAAKELKTVN